MSTKRFMMASKSLRRAEGATTTFNPNGNSKIGFSAAQSNAKNVNPTCITTCVLFAGLKARLIIFAEFEENSARNHIGSIFGRSNRSVNPFAEDILRAVFDSAVSENTCT
jgi:hypothetical protein